MRQSFTRKAFVISALIFPLVTLVAHSALADKANFRVQNDSEVAITQLYVSDSSLDAWNNDLLEDIGSLSTGDSLRVVFADESNDRCLYDIKAIFADGQNVEDYRINVCTNEQYQFYDTNGQ